MVNQDDKVMPSVAAKEINAQLQALIKAKKITSNDEYFPKQKELTLTYLAKIKTSGLPAKEEMAYATLLEQVGRDKEATAIYQKLANGDGDQARLASKSLLNSEMKVFNEADAKKDPVRFEKLLRDYRSRFTPLPEDLPGLYMYVNALANHYTGEGEYEAAIRVIDEELAYLNYDTPYFSYMLMGKYKPYEELGRKEEIEAKLTAGIKKFEEIVAQREAKRPEGEPKNGAYDRTTGGYKGIVKNLKASRTKMNLINSPAPGFNLTHFFNTEKFDFAERIKGKVVFLDFFANWCGPCIGTFPEMRQFYADYTPKGVVVIGITGFQGSMSNHGADRVANLSKEEEVELMKVFIKHQNVTWPVVFSDRNCYDPAYGVMGVPTAVIIDKKGRIRMFTHPYYQEKNRAMIDKLLAEEN